MKIPIRILVGNIPDPLSSEESWDEIISNWEDYAQIWNLNNSSDAPVLDMFEDEGISVKSVVKDISDPKKLFTEYSRKFTVPASKKNNRIFKHYYNIDITSGLDSRELIPAKILMNNVTYKVGNIRIEGAGLNMGVPSSYKITFIGKLSELARQIGVDRLSSLNLSTYDISSFDVQAEVSNITSRPLMFPLSSRGERFVLNSNVSSLGIENARNIAFSTSTPAEDYGIKEVGLVGAMKVGTILDEIEDKYNFQFEGAFTRNYVRDLYMYLHQTDKERTGEALLARAAGLQWASGSPTFSGDWTRYDDAIVYNGGNISVGTGGHRIYEIRIYGQWTGDAKIKLLHNGAVIGIQDTPGTYTTHLEVNDSHIGDAFYFEAEANTSKTVNITVELEMFEYEEEEDYISEGYFSQATDELTCVANIGTAGTFTVSKNMPKMTIMDFLSSLFKMFNIVAEVDNQFNISTKHYDHFMSEGVVRDITEYVDQKAYDVNRPNTYSSMQMEFSDPKVALEMGYLAVNGKQYGELSYELVGQNNVRLSGSQYKLKIENQRVPVEPLNDLYTNSETNVVYTQFSDLKGAEQSIAPMFTYIVRQNAALEIAFYDNITVTSATSYSTPSNTYNPQHGVPDDRNGLVGLYFGEELNEYSPAYTRSGIGLWSNFYRGTTAMMFDEDKRRVKLNAHIPQSLLLNLSLADTLVISNRFYNLISIDTNYLTGQSVLDLALVGRSKLQQFEVTNQLVENLSGSSDFRFTYMHKDGYLVEEILAIQASSPFEMVGTLIGFSHPDFRTSEA